MATINSTNRKLDRTIRIFDRFLNVEMEVPVNEFDAVNSYLKEVMNTKPSADTLTTSIFMIAQSNSIPVMDLLAELKQQPGQLELTSTLAFYLNNLRSRATLLGINGSVVPNINAARNVVA